MKTFRCWAVGYTRQRMTQLHGGVPSCIWHVIDDRTCVYEQRIDMGVLISWFQYWTTTNGILIYPLSESTRSMFKVACHVPIALQCESLVANGYRFDRAFNLPIPKRIDLFPGTRPDENGHPIPTSLQASFWTTYQNHQKANLKGRSSDDAKLLVQRMIPVVPGSWWFDVVAC